MSVVRLVAPKKRLSVSDLVKNLVGNLDNPPTERDLALAEEMEDLADEHGGEYDSDNNSVIFDGKDSSVTVFASTDKDDNVYYQAVHERFKPRIFKSGEPKDSFKAALEALQLN